MEERRGRLEKNAHKTTTGSGGELVRKEGRKFDGPANTESRKGGNLMF